MIKIKIGKKIIGRGLPCFIIVDVGANHNRSLKTAKKLIDAAAESGADAIKFQTYKAEYMYSKKTPAFSKDTQKPWDLIKSVELPRQWHKELNDYARKRRIIFFSTPFDKEAVDQLDEIGVPLFKIASFELVDLPLISYVAGKGKPIIISTGLADMVEIKDAYKACLKAGNKKVIFLQCASAYPAEPGILNLRAMDTLRKKFSVPVGLSDHSIGIHISCAAVAMGACLIEKHFTLDRGQKGPDHSFAVEPDELKEMIKNIREVEKALGDGRKRGPSRAEIEAYRKGRRSVHAKIKIPKGTKITIDMLTVKRPGYGIKPKFIKSIVGKTAKKNIDEEQWITRKMI